ncbi:MAG: hypothetical protein PHE89_00025 [Alphaproteobacteria bacterium]|nr:hypothetical protein [Alphaproteobacteria bacterium]
MNFLKNHWFGFILSLFVLFFILIFVLVLISPQRDAQSRGFTACTDGFVEQAGACGNGYGCLIGSVIGHGTCTVKVVCFGVKNWLSGKQETPWANYLFNPQYLENEELDENLQDFYNENPNLTEQMNVFRKNSKELESDEE